VSLEKETEIRSAWDAFRSLNVPDYEEHKEGVIRTEDVKKALAAQGLKLKPSDLSEAIEILDPESEGIVTFSQFFEVSAIYQNQSNESGDSSNDDDDAAGNAAQQAELDEAFKLFTKGYSRPITVQDLREIARTLKEDVDESVLRAMVLEANGNKGVSSGVSREDFADVAARAGALR
jgi:hydroxyacylglutathione hydrolase